MTVLRIEHKEDGSGPYNGRYNQSCSFRICHQHNTHPDPHEEGLVHTSEHYSAFKIKNN